ncbi:unnamed protein product, partial [Urochloa humidicola]
AELLGGQEERRRLTGPEHGHRARERAEGGLREEVVDSPGEVRRRGLHVEERRGAPDLPPRAAAPIAIVRALLVSLALPGLLDRRFGIWKLLQLGRRFRIWKL